MTEDDFNDAARFMVAQGLVAGFAYGPHIQLGGIVGVAKIIDCVDASASSWWMGPYGLVIDRAHPLPFVRCPGTVAPLFWTPPTEVIDQLRPALDALKLTP
jgi:hypothetical protein